ncbi:MAG: hypothetical protein JWO52_2445 [Gammaproteobacteria bacterium]|nr:hypothetical protein [Gammaproteobacteria bacterium]
MDFHNPGASLDELLLDPGWFVTVDNPVSRVVRQRITANELLIRPGCSRRERHKAVPIIAIEARLLRAIEFIQFGRQVY